MWELLRRFRKLPGPARRIFLRAAALLPWVALRLRMQGFQATKNALLRASLNAAPGNNPEEMRIKVAMTARMVRTAARYGPGNPSCLEESLVLLSLLNKQGITAQLRIGVKNAPQFEAHAWVEFEGKALNESEALHHHYAAFEAEFTGPPTRS